jgi:hypothetical protein
MTLGNDIRGTYIRVMHPRLSSKSENIVSPREYFVAFSAEALLIVENRQKVLVSLLYVRCSVNVRNMTIQDHANA